MTKVTMMMNTRVTPLIAECLMAGNIENLFPLLAGWPRGKLRALKSDLDRCYEVSRSLIEEAYHKACLEPANFLLPANQKAIDEEYHDTAKGLVETFSEIASVVDFYLKPEEKKQ